MCVCVCVYVYVSVSVCILYVWPQLEFLIPDIQWPPETMVE